MIRIISIFVLGLFSAFFVFRGYAAEKPDKPIIVNLKDCYDPSKPENSVPLLKLVEENPRLELRKWGGISLPGGGGRAPLLMSIAGGTAPDIYYSWFHIIRSNISQRFLYPLNEWIETDANENGQIDNAESKWDGWANVPLLWRQVATENGKIYGIPYAGTWYYGLVYRKDMVRNCRLDPENPPETWDEFWKWCQRLTIPNKNIAGANLQRGQRAFAIADYPFAWLPWMQSAGGSPVVQYRKSPTTGKEYEFAMEECDFIAPDGEDLKSVPSRWKAAFDSPAGMESTSFYRKLMWGAWLQDPSWAMACCILPGVWAGAGMGSLIYIAALSSFPEDYYEAAAIDGAGLVRRVFHIALPQLLPLIIINFVGAFIGAFQGMGSIFLLTFGGPGNETMVISLAIWQEAYNNLRFSTATTMAWFLGVGLIGFTYMQIRFLRRVEFRRAEDN